MEENTDKPCNFGGPLPTFKWVCEELFHRLDTIHHQENRTSITEQKRKVVELFLAQWRGTVGPQLYPVLRLILPHKDRVRLYNIKDYYLGKRVLELLKIPKRSATTEKVINWKRTSGEKMSNVCIEVTKERRSDQKGGVITIDELNDILDKLAQFDCKKQDQMEIFKYLFDKMSFIELQYFFDIILKKNIVRNMENTVLYLWHPDAINYLKVVTNLEPLCDKLYDPTKRLTPVELSINLGNPFAPMLAKKPNLSYTKVVQSLQSNFIIEEKMDGERIQLHYVNYGEHLYYWSRRGTDYTYLYGPTLNSGCISPHLQFISSVKSIVLDGEMVSYDPQHRAILPFGVLKGSAIQELQRLNGADIDKSEELTARPLFIAFDLLYLNGSSLTSKPLEQRKQFLNAVLKPTPRFVEIIKTVEATDESMITKALELAISKGSEGIVLKQSQSRYLIDKRSDYWVKIKPEYLEEFGENVDLVVIGREKSKKDLYYCALKVDDSPLFWSFCRVANGFDHEDYRKVEELTRGKWHLTSDEGLPSTSLVEFGKRIPVEWIDPRDSFVIEVKARSVDRSLSKNYKVETTLYNAYSRRIRDDKDWKTCTTLDEYRQIKLSRRSTDALTHELNVKRKRLERKRKRESQDEEIWNTDIQSIKSEIFSELTFMVISDGFYSGNTFSDEEIITVIRQNGGSITKNPMLCDDSTLRIIGNKQTSQALALREQGYDILKVSWLFDSIRASMMCKVTPQHCLLVSDTLNELSRERVDALGVGYTSMFTPSSLERLLNELAVEDDQPILQDLKLIQLFGQLKPYIVSLDNYQQQMITTRLRAFGGEITTELAECNIVIVSNIESSELSHLVSHTRRKLASLAKFTEGKVETVRVVSVDWVHMSIIEGVQVDPQDYHVIMSRDEE